MKKPIFITDAKSQIDSPSVLLSAAAQLLERDICKFIDIYTDGKNIDPTAFKEQVFKMIAGIDNAVIKDILNGEETSCKMNLRSKIAKLRNDEPEFYEMVFNKMFVFKPQNIVTLKCQLDNDKPFIAAPAQCGIGRDTRSKGRQGIPPYMFHIAINRYISRPYAEELVDSNMIREDQTFWMSNGGIVYWPELDNLQIEKVDNGYAFNVISIYSEYDEKYEVSHHRLKVEIVYDSYPVNDEYKVCEEYMAYPVADKYGRFLIKADNHGWSVIDDTINHAAIQAISNEASIAENYKQAAAWLEAMGVVAEGFMPEYAEANQSYITELKAKEARYINDFTKSFYLDDTYSMLDSTEYAVIPDFVSIKVDTPDFININGKEAFNQCIQYHFVTCGAWRDDFRIIELPCVKSAYRPDIAIGKHVYKTELIMSPKHWAVRLVVQDRYSSYKKYRDYLYINLVESPDSYEEKRKQGLAWCHEHKLVNDEELEMLLGLDMDDIDEDSWVVNCGDNNEAESDIVEENTNRIEIITR